MTLPRPILHILVLLLLTGSLPAAGFNLTDTRGQAQVLSHYEGRWVLLNLWASWCHVCLAEMPELQVLANARPDLALIGLAVDGQTPQRVMQITRELGVTYPQVAGNATIARPFAARGYPASVLYDPQGRRVLFKEGMITRHEVEAAMLAGSVTRAGD